MTYKDVNKQQLICFYFNAYDFLWSLTVSNSIIVFYLVTLGPLTLWTNELTRHKYNRQYVIYLYEL